MTSYDSIITSGVAVFMGKNGLGGCGEWLKKTVFEGGARIVSNAKAQKAAKAQRRDRNIRDKRMGKVPSTEYSVPKCRGPRTEEPLRY
jgi:hypothetical protein